MAGDEVRSPPTDFYQRPGATLPEGDDPLDPRRAQRFRPTVHAGGAWQPNEQHMGPVSGVIVHAVEAFLAARGARLQLSRITYEILGLIPAEDFDITVEVVRPGRTIELIEATMVSGGRACVRARCWLLSQQDTAAIAGGAPEPMPGPETVARWDGSSVWTGGFIAAVQIHVLPGHRPGRTRAWLRTEVGLVEDEPASDLARFVGLVDTANGIAVRMPPGQWMFPNVDLTLHLFRAPRGSWVGLDTTVIFGCDGVGLTTSWLHDQEGPVGRAEQILTIRAIPSGGDN